MKKIDAVLLALMLSIVISSICAYLSNNWIIGLVTLVCFLAISATGLLLVKKKSKHISKEDFFNNLLLLGKSKSNEYISQLNKGMLPLDDKFCVGNMLISNNFHYGNLGEEEVANCYRKAIALGYSSIVIYCYQVDKKALNLAFRLDVETKIINGKKFYQLLKQQGILPQKQFTILKRKGIKNIINNLVYIPLKYFVISSIWTALLSFIVPMRLYYLIFASINAIIGIIVFVIQRRQNSVE